MSYINCTSCGQKALSVATQCPHCGIPFESRLASYPAARPKRSVLPVVLIAAALGGILFATSTALKQKPAISEGFSPPPPAAEPIRKEKPVAAPPAAVAATPTDSIGTARDTSGVQLAASEPAPVASPPPEPTHADPTPPAAVVVEAQPEAGSTALLPKAPPLPSIKHAVYGPTERRYTNIWVNVRKAPRPSAPVVRVLKPGEPVQVDSLSQQWYRVVDEGQAVGYVYRGFVDADPPESSN